MKLIIAGSRTIHPSTEMLAAYVKHFNLIGITQIVSGGAQGVDKAAEWYAIDTGIDLKLFPADWEAHGRAAGPIRNQIMARYADALLLIWDGESNGSGSMKHMAKVFKIPIFEVVLKRTI